MNCATCVRLSATPGYGHDPFSLKFHSNEAPVLELRNTLKPEGRCGDDDPNADDGGGDAMVNDEMVKMVVVEPSTPERTGPRGCAQSTTNRAMKFAPLTNQPLTNH